MRDFDPTASEFISTGYLARSRPGSGFFGDFGSVLGVGSALIGASSSKSAAKSQERAAQAQMDESRRQYDQTRSDQAPWRNAGAAGVNQLAYLLGLPGYGATAGGTGALTREQIRAQLLPQYTTNLANTDWNQYRGLASTADTINGVEGYYRGGSADDSWDGRGYFTPNETPNGQYIDENALNAAIDARFNSQPQGIADNSQYGSLLKRFGIEDFQADPGYAFRQSEGQKAVERSAAARGGLFSGAAGKALQKYSQDLASQEYGNAYNRYNTDQTNTYNRLAGIAGIGQQAQNQVNAAGANTTASVNNALAGMGNAQAAGSIGVGNAFTGALNNYNSYNMLNSILNRGSNVNVGSGMSQSPDALAWGGY